jgi:hypothetical protein
MGDPDQARLERLRQLRNRPQRDHSLGFLRDQFEKQVARPFRQLEGVAVIWEQLVPQAIREHCRLESLQRGVLRVAVDDSACLYELDGLLRSGLQQQIIRGVKGKAIRRIQLKQAPIGR